jgi:FlaA1/EpsC-like NDP-sugar epimerase
MSALFEHLRLSGWKRRPLILAALVLITVTSGLTAFLLRFELDIPATYRPHLLVALSAWLLVKLASFTWHRLDRLAFRFFSLNDLRQLVRANILGSLGAATLILPFAPVGFPRSIYFLDLVLCILLSAAAFLAKRLMGEAIPNAKEAGRPTLIYGAGRAGVQLLEELRQNPHLRYTPIGFIDDDANLQGVATAGLRVLGSGKDLATISSNYDIQEVLIATPSASEAQTLEILQLCRQANVRFHTVAGLGSLLDAKPIAARIRDVDVCDLLSRDPVELDHQLLRHKIEGKVVMVTGAAGSIGSELCRQIAAFRPAAIVAFELAETPLFHLEHEMKALFPAVPFRREIGNVQNLRRVTAVISSHRPSIIYHAAAYKHVPIMESDIIEAVFNNVCGTYNVIRAAQDCKVADFVLISSDKAVRPTSVMGATKRLCELLVRAMPHSSTRFVAVRFGNVLGSNGSVIPIFKQQIQDGGPVTVTHPEMQRYFMTIPEASQLVLQAGAMGRGGEIFVLDMGNQVKIVDIARKLILLSGLVPDVDIQIHFTGMRHGEKLYEELNLDDETNVPTPHRKIKSFVDSSVPSRWIFEQVEQLKRHCEAGDTYSVMQMIRDLCPEYVPSQHALALSAPAQKPNIPAVPKTLVARAAVS